MSSSGSEPEPELNEQREITGPDSWKAGFIYTEAFSHFLLEVREQLSPDLHTQQLITHSGPQMDTQAHRPGTNQVFILSCLNKVLLCEEIWVRGRNPSLSESFLSSDLCKTVSVLMSRVKKNNSFVPKILNKTNKTRADFTWCKSLCLNKNRAIICVQVESKWVFIWILFDEHAENWNHASYSCFTTWAHK